MSPASFRALSEIGNFAGKLSGHENDQLIDAMGLHRKSLQSPVNSDAKYRDRRCTCECNFASNDRSKKGIHHFFLLIRTKCNRYRCIFLLTFIRECIRYSFIYPRRDVTEGRNAAVGATRSIK